MQSLTIGRRFSIACTLLCLAIAGIGIFATLRFLSLRTALHAIAHDAIPGTALAGRIKALQAEAQLRVYRLVNATDAGSRQRYASELEAITREISEACSSYESTITAERDRELFASFQRHRADFLELRAQMLGLVETDRAAASAQMAGTIRQAYANYSGAAQALFDFNVEAGRARGTSAADQVGRDTVVVSLVSVVSILAGACLSIFAVLWLNRALRAIATDLAHGAEQVASAATQVAAASQSLATGASEQAASLEETSSSLEEVASMSRQNAGSAASARTLSERTRDAVDSSARRVEEMRTAMDEIHAASREVASIIKSIDDIAFQTNILALNAAVEAARAGEAGAGFAVVADEVRGLARRAADSARETAQRIEISMTKSSQGVTLAGSAAGALQDVVGRAREVDALIADIANASQEQNRGLEQVNVALAQMNKITQENASSAEESASAAEELTSQAASQFDSVERLRRMVDGGAAGRLQSAKALLAPSIVERSPGARWDVDDFPRGSDPVGHKPVNRLRALAQSGKRA